MPRPHRGVAALVAVAVLAVLGGLWLRRADGPPGPSAMGISFGAPAAVATAASPSSTAAHLASDDHLSPLTLNAGLSDSVAVGDLDGDGNDDVARTNVSAGTVSIFLGDGRGGFASPTVNDVGTRPTSVAIGDLDLDGRLDLGVANFGSNDVAILLGVGDGTFGPASFVPVAAPRNVAVGRFDDDDNPDLAVASGGAAPGPNQQAGGVAILAGDGTGGFELAQLIRPTIDGDPIAANYVGVGDFDGSGLDDLAVAVGASLSAGDRPAGSDRPTGDDVLIFLNQHELPGSTAAPFGNAPDQPAIRVGGLPIGIAVTDLDGDDNPDLAVMDSGSRDITTLLGDSEGRFAVRATNLTLGGAPRTIAVGDFDGDGAPDLVTANFLSSTVSVLRGNGDGTLQPAVDFWAGASVTGVAVGRFDRGARDDLVVGRMGIEQLFLFRNESPERGDGVLITRDIPYVTTSDDPLAAHHTLDVYLPPKGTASLTGKGQPYPVVLFVHGGDGVTGGKSAFNHLMRSLALEGIVAVSTNYRLGPDLFAEATSDVAEALRWVRANVGATEYGGDHDDIVVFGYSAGASLAAALGTESRWEADRQHIRGLVLGGYCFPAAPVPGIPPSLLIYGDADVQCSSSALGAAWQYEIVEGRDHFTLLSEMAQIGDPGRALMLNFLRGH